MCQHCPQGSYSHGYKGLIHIKACIKVLKSFKETFPSYVCVYVLVTQSCPTLCNPVDNIPPVSTVHGILQARILEWM